MAKLFLMCGCSGCGKSTFAKEFAKRKNILYFGIDEFYEKYNGDECRHVNTFDVWITFYQAIHDAEMKGLDIIVDTNALTKSSRDQFLDWFPTFEHHLIFMDCLDELRDKNNQARRRVVPKEKMEEMRRKLEVPYQWKEDYRWKSIAFIWNDKNKIRMPLPSVVHGDEQDWKV